MAVMIIALSVSVTVIVYSICQYETSHTATKECRQMNKCAIYCRTVGGATIQRAKELLLPALVVLFVLVTVLAPVEVRVEFKVRLFPQHQLCASNKVH